MTLSANETLYWQHKAALLDPRSWTWYYDNWIDERDWGPITVPEGKTWFTTNLYQAAINGSGMRSAYLRKLDVREALALPAGTTITNQVSPERAYAGIMLCKPESVIDIDSRYTSDPKELFYTRDALLKTLPIREAAMHITAGGDSFRIENVLLPDDFTYGMVLAASCYDVAWITLDGTPDVVEGPNTQSEINNQHSQRFASSLMQPFSREVFDRIQIQTGNRWGTNMLTPDTPNTVGSNYTIEGYGSLLYCVLPSGW